MADALISVEILVYPWFHQRRPCRLVRRCLACGAFCLFTRDEMREGGPGLSLEPVRVAGGPAELVGVAAPCLPSRRGSRRSSVRGWTSRASERSGGPAPFW